MIVWGGLVEDATSLANGGRYDPAADRWSGTSEGAGCPSARDHHTAVWNGRRIIVWGGSQSIESDLMGDGGEYDPTTDSWDPIPWTPDGPSSRDSHGAVWTGRLMLIWAGSPGPTSSGAAYGVPGPRRDIAAGRGAGYPNASEVSVHDVDGTLLGEPFFPYASGHWGANVSSCDLDAAVSPELVTGPGPGMVHGPHVRAWSASGAPIARVSFYAYATLRYGVNVRGAGVESDAGSELLTGAGPGSVFGPHVRGFDAEAAVRALPGLSLFAYSTLKFGVNVSSGDLDADGAEEILTGPGPGPTFAPQIRGFDYDAGSVLAMPGVSFVAFADTAYGAQLAAGNISEPALAYQEIVVTPGAGPSEEARVLGFRYDGSLVQALPGFDRTPYTTAYGGRVAAGDVNEDGRDDLVASPGPDPAAAPSVGSWSYGGAMLVPLGPTFIPFPGSYGNNVAVTTGS